jgi:hypothetical protein
MAARRADSPSNRPRRPPATTPKGREDQLIALAMDEAEKVIRSGKATSQLLVHFLRLGSTREELEKERLEQENKLLQAKVDSLASAQRIEDLYGKALKAMRVYSGQEDEEDAENQMLRRTPAASNARGTI